MARDSTDRSKHEPEETVTGLGPADAVLFDTLGARLADIDLYTAPDGALLATTPDTSTAVRLAVTDRGLAATETVEARVTADLEPVEHIEPAPEPDVTADTDLSTRLRGD